MTQPNPRVVYIVVGSLAFTLISYATTLAICAVSGVTPSVDVLSPFKDLGLFVGGALAGLLSRTGQVKADAPTDVTVVNQPDEPVPTKEEQP